MGAALAAPTALAYHRGMPRSWSSAPFLLLASLAGCASSEKSTDTRFVEVCDDDGGSVDTSGPGIPGNDGGLVTEAGPAPVDAGTCEPPDLLVVLDRTMTMHFRPDGTETPAAENNPEGRKKTKFALALSAVRTMMSSFDTQVRFGLELWPRERDGCISVKERIDIAWGAPPPRPQNTFCEAGEIRVPTGLANAGSTAPLLDPEAIPLCYSTPLGAALDTASSYLGKIKVAKRNQYLLLITDGADYDLSCPSPTHPDPIARLAAMADTGLPTFVVGFGADLSSSGVDPVKMNRLACAAKTAKDFATKCKLGSAGVYEPVDATGADRLFYVATDADSLGKALGSIAASLGCNSCLK
jgi:hypothetical protein